MYTKVPTDDAKRQGNKVVTTKWVDTNKGSQAEPNQLFKHLPAIARVATVRSLTRTAHDTARSAVASGSKGLQELLCDAEVASLQLKIRLRLRSGDFNPSGFSNGLRPFLEKHAVSGVCFVNLFAKVLELIVVLRRACGAAVRVRGFASVTTCLSITFTTAVVAGHVIILFAVVIIHVVIAVVSSQYLRLLWRWDVAAPGHPGIWRPTRRGDLLNPLSVPPFLHRPPRHCSSTERCRTAPLANNQVFPCGTMNSNVASTERACKLLAWSPHTFQLARGFAQTCSPNSMTFPS